MIIDYYNAITTSVNIVHGRCVSVNVNVAVNVHVNVNDIKVFCLVGLDDLFGCLISLIWCLISVIGGLISVIDGLYSGLIGGLISIVTC